MKLIFCFSPELVVAPKEVVGIQAQSINQQNKTTKITLFVCTKLFSSLWFARGIVIVRVCHFLAGMFDNKERIVRLHPQPSEAVQNNCHKFLTKSEKS